MNQRQQTISKALCQQFIRDNQLSASLIQPLMVLLNTAYNSGIQSVSDSGTVAKERDDLQDELFEARKEVWLRQIKEAIVEKEEAELKALRLELEKEALFSLIREQGFEVIEETSSCMETTEGE